MCESISDYVEIVENIEGQCLIADGKRLEGAKIKSKFQ